MELFKSRPRVVYTNAVGDKVYPVVVDIKKGIKSTEDIQFVSSDVNPENSTLKTLEPLKEELNNITKEVLEQVIESLGDVRVNPVPQMEVGYNSYR